MAVPNIPELELIEARERADAGLRLALPTAYERAREEVRPGEPMELEDVARVARSLEEVREELMRRVQPVLDQNRGRKGAADLHLKVGLMVLDHEDIQRELAEEYGS